ncbi:ABC transporter ATP-binding protein [Cohaesibacter celericrescens]|uniref:ABC transporter ATP-binding protein n=1 Tax=Cohaesibacter celericrescens TaxID=2067669 RepID=UPI0035689315
MSSSKMPNPITSENIVISAQQVSKKFRLFDNPNDRIKEALHPFRKNYHREFWALNDISLDVRKGEIVGILGRNGSGKSTLLQIICGVMRPTHGAIHTSGRISALLELGAGFNPEFTGRENVLLNGAIMGFEADEMKARLPEIEAFADVGAFFDQPVKAYSSGMFVRVAFAAAISIDPEILVVDEALSVGDAKFQHKCYKKIESFRAAGKTILLVTHDVGQITAHCDRAILIDKGSMLMDGPSRDVVDKYIEMLFSDTDELPLEDRPTRDIGTAFKSLEKKEKSNLEKFTEIDKRIEQRGSYCKDEARYGNLAAEIIDCVVEVSGELNAVQLQPGKPARLHLKVAFHQQINPMYGFAIKNLSGIEIYATNSFMCRQPMPPGKAGETKVVVIEFDVPLQAGEYFLDLGVTAVDGSEGGLAADVRRSVMMVQVASNAKKKSFNGLVDLSPKFSVK